MLVSPGDLGLPPAKKLNKIVVKFYSITNEQIEQFKIQML